MSVDISADSNLDAILTEVGEFGVYQTIIYLLICIPNLLSATFVVNYMFSANTLDYRCKVPECDVSENNREIEYDHPWSSFAIPSSKDKMESCVRYAPIEIRNESSLSNQCRADMFDTARKIECSEFVYKTNEKNIQSEFNIHCSDSYKLALVGTVNNIGRFIFLPLTGFLSDKFGRLTVVVIGMLLSSIFGLIKSFSVDYIMYLILEFLEASAGTCTFAGIYILSIEWINSKYRVLGTTLISVSYPIGEMLLGITAMYINDFRTLIRVLYAPGLLVVSYFWLVPESIRWLLVTGRVDQAIDILKKIASANGKNLSEKSIGMIKMRYDRDFIARNCPIVNANDTKNHQLLQSLYSIVKSKTLCLRFFICCFIWIACCYCYYGLSLYATQIPGKNRYTSFIFIVAVEIPGVLIALPLLNRFERRKLLFSTLFIAAISTFVIPWIPKNNTSFNNVCD